MTADDRRLDRRIKWTNRGAFALLALILAIAIWTLASVSIEQGKEEAALEAQTEEIAKQNRLLQKQNDALARLNERQQETDAARDKRLASAIDQVEAVTAQQFAQHDLNVATKLNDLLAQIAALLDRPLPTPVALFSPPPSAPESAAGGGPAPAAAPAPRSTTPTTSPGNSDLCTRKPHLSVCRKGNP